MTDSHQRQTLTRIVEKEMMIITGIQRKRLNDNIQVYAKDLKKKFCCYPHQPQPQQPHPTFSLRAKPPFIPFRMLLSIEKSPILGGTTWKSTCAEHRGLTPRSTGMFSDQLTHCIRLSEVNIAHRPAINGEPPL